MTSILDVCSWVLSNDIIISSRFECDFNPLALGDKAQWASPLGTWESESEVGLKHFKFPLNREKGAHCLHLSCRYEH
jgi:hypothetical protein